MIRILDSSHLRTIWSRYLLHDTRVESTGVYSVQRGLFSFFTSFSCAIFGYLSWLLLFPCLLDSRVQHCIICLFPSDCAVSIVEYLCVCLSFHFLSFLHLSYISLLYLFPLFFPNIFTHVCLAYGKVLAEKMFDCLKPAAAKSFYFPPVLYTLFLMVISFIGRLFHLSLDVSFIYYNRPQVGLCQVKIAKKNS